MRELTELYYFSPTGGTKKAGMLLCEGISWDVEAVDLGKKEEAPREPEGDLVVAAMPVFGGRIPGVAAEKLRTLNGKGKKAVAVAVYGNRAYEDALLELKDILEECGFEVTAAAALVAQHSMVPEVGAGRPDEEDQKEILEFGRKVRVPMVPWKSQETDLIRMRWRSRQRRCPLLPVRSAADVPWPVRQMQSGWKMAK